MSYQTLREVIGKMEPYMDYYVGAIYLEGYQGLNDQTALHINLRGKNASHKQSISGDDE